MDPLTTDKPIRLEDLQAVGSMAELDSMYGGKALVALANQQQ